MDKYFLVLTKKKNYFSADEKKIYFSKYYCGYDYDFKSTNDILIEENMDYDFMPDVMRIVNKVLPALADTLNSIHGTQFSYAFWDKILCYWWLPALLRNVYLKYQKIKYLFKNYNNEPIRIALLRQDEWIGMMDVSDYIFSCWEEKYNLQLWTKIIETFCMINPLLEKEYISYGTEPSDGSTRNEAKEALQKDPLSSNSDLFLERLLSRINKAEPPDSISNLNAIANFIGRTISEKMIDPLDAKCYMYCSGFKNDLFDRIISSTNGQARPIPDEIISRKYRKTGKNIDINKRNIFKNDIWENIKGCEEDEKKVIDVIIDEIPMCFLELFSDIRKQYESFLTPNVNYLISQHGAYNNTAFLFYSAEMHEKFQTELRGIQHGGNYQTERFYWGDYKLSDKMYCWGKSNMDNNFIPSAPYKLNQYPLMTSEYSERDTDYILYIDNSYDPYIVQTAPVLYSYRQIQKLLDFLAVLDNDVIANMRVRKYTDEYGWDIEQIINNHISEIHFDEFDDNLASKEYDFPVKIRNSRICIFNVLGTGWLEVLAINKPFIAFIHEHMFPLRESEEPYMEMLYDVQIFHHTGESAGRLLNEIYQDVETWWNEPHRQKVVKTIRERYWNDFGDPDEWWVKEFKRLVK